ncbi:hypothetical protein GobsT_00560 [Gemmata obscuriglobus]|nr:hypothetical protein GobsT_00560 [Gemmata obscuriglobus]VTR98258.1 unnamed protein product [Gemmata obscuriglobus UQM 2246]
MKKSFALLVFSVMLAAVGCEGKTLPSGPVDTSDPNKTYGGMAPLPKGGKDPVKPGGMPKAP